MSLRHSTSRSSSKRRRRLLPRRRATAVQVPRRLDLTKRILTVGESKTDAGTGRTIPMNEDLYHAVVDYTNWYTGRFGTAKEEFRQANRFQATLRAHKPSLKTAWRNARNRANVEGRFHDARHTFVTDLAESGAGDEVIRDMAGHVSKEMLSHYSHIRMQAKRRAIAALTTKPTETHQPPRESKKPEMVVQDSVLGDRIN